MVLNLSANVARATRYDVLVPVAGLMLAGAARTSVHITVTVLVATIVLCALANVRLHRTIARAAERLSSFAVTDASRPFSLETDIAEFEERLVSVHHRLKDTHPLSGLPMREALIERIEADARGVLGVVAFLDFERLAAFDPAKGDRICSKLAERLAKMVPASRLLAQVDRGQFAVWFGPDSTEEAARAELEAICYALTDTILDGDREVEPQLKLRIAGYGSDESLAAPAFVSRTLAFLALPEGSSLPTTGKLDLVEVARDRYDLEQDLRQAISRRELVLVFQPLIDASAGHVCGAEALLRWHHPVRGFVSPARFVPVMEALGLSDEIGAWVINAAAREAGQWRERGFNDLRIAVNVSGAQLDHHDLPVLVQRTLQRHGLAASSLEIELTESVATNNSDHCSDVFRQLREMGVKLAVDDFGTGYSGFSSLRTLRFDKIKIDREFVTDVDTRRDSQAICQSIIALGRGLGIRVLAEGIERPAEYHWLKRHGCQHFQGYYFSRPLDADQFAAFVRDTRTLKRLVSVSDGDQTFIERLSA